MLSSGRLSDRLGAFAGVAFCVLVFLSVAVVDPQRGVSDQELLTWWADAGNRDGFVISMYTLLVASPLFLVFVARLRTRLRSADATGWLEVMQVCGVAVAVAFGVCAVLRGVVTGSMRFADEPLPGVDTLRYATELAYTAWNLVMVFIVALVTVVAVLTIATRAFPRWVGWLGIVVGGAVVILFATLRSPFALPLIHIWVIANSACLWRTPAPAPIASTASPELAAARA